MFRLRSAFSPTDDRQDGKPWRPPIRPRKAREECADWSKRWAGCINGVTDGVGKGGETCVLLLLLCQCGNVGHADIVGISVLIIESL